MKNKKYHNPVAGYHGYSNHDAFMKLQSMCGHSGGQAKNYGADHNINASMRSLRAGTSNAPSMSVKRDAMRAFNKY